MCCTQAKFAFPAGGRPYFQRLSSFSRSPPVGDVERGIHQNEIGFEVEKFVVVKSVWGASPPVLARTGPRGAVCVAFLTTRSNSRVGLRVSVVSTKVHRKHGGRPLRSVSGLCQARVNSSRSSVSMIAGCGLNKPASHFRSTGAGSFGTAIMSRVSERFATPTPKT